MYCNDDVAKIENYDKVIADETRIWHCHHRLETHKYKDRSRKEWVERGEVTSLSRLKAFHLYYKRPPEELIFLTPSEHSKLERHNKEAREKMSKAKRGKPSGKRGIPISEAAREKLSKTTKGKPKPWLRDRPKSEEHKKKLSDVHKGIGWWMKNNVMVRSRGCPGPGWERGRLIGHE